MIDREELSAQPFTRMRCYVLRPHRGSRLVWISLPKPRAFTRWAWHGCGRRYLQSYSVTLRGQCVLLAVKRAKSETYVPEGGS